MCNAINRANTPIRKYDRKAIARLENLITFAPETKTNNNKN